MNAFIHKTLVLLGSLLVFTLVPAPIVNAISPPQVSNGSYSFIVAGHTYGSHHDTNSGLYPKLLDSLSSHANPADFIVLTGDFTRLPATQEKLDKVTRDLDGVGLPYYFVIGNNDNSQPVIQYFKENYGGIFYYFTIKDFLFIFLDTQSQTVQVPVDHVKRIADLLQTSPKFVFVFSHELIWNSDPGYKGIRANNRSRFGHPDLFHSNFWSDLMPILSESPMTKFYIIAGDIAGRPDSAPAFYQQIGNVTLIASGMGEIRDENYLKVTVSGENIAFNLIPLNPNNQLKPLSYYSPKHLSSSKLINLILSIRSIPAITADKVISTIRIIKTRYR